MRVVIGETRERVGFRRDSSLSQTQKTRLTNKEQRQRLTNKEQRQRLANKEQRQRLTNKEQRQVRELSSLE